MSRISSMYSWQRNLALDGIDFMAPLEAQIINGSCSK
jgi:hypothetical protein